MKRRGSRHAHEDPKEWWLSVMDRSDCSAIAVFIVAIVLIGACLWVVLGLTSERELIAGVPAYVDKAQVAARS